MKTIRALAILLLLGAISRGAAGQEWLVSPEEGTLLQPPGAIGSPVGAPPVSSLPSPAGEMYAQPSLPPEMADFPPQGDPAMEIESKPHNEDLAPSAGGAMERPASQSLPQPLVPYADPGGDLACEETGSIRYLDACPALLESSGTWLRRGFWYAEMDAVLLNRQWDRHGLVLAGENALGNFLPDVNTPILIGNELRIAGGKPGIEGLPRITLGTFLFRDGDNRDHTAELTWFGGGEFKQHGELTAVTAAGLQVPDFVDRTPSNGGAGNPSFDGARNSVFDYNSVMDSFECNYFVKNRLRRDRMVLKPSGEWVRRANPSRVTSFLAGLRYINLREQLAWTASGIPSAGATADGAYNVDVDNTLLGTQIGGSFGYEADRWSLTGLGKVGAYWNQIDMNSAFSITNTAGDDVGSGRTSPNADTLAAVGQVSMLGRWHLRPNVSIRAGFELLVIESIAMSPSQLNFIPGNYPTIAQSDYSTYMGASLGWEAYW